MSDPYDDAIHMPDHTRVNRTLCGQAYGELNVQASRPDWGSGCWTCIKEDEHRENTGASYWKHEPQEGR